MIPRTGTAFSIDQPRINNSLTLMLTKEQLQERALLVRIHEGNCGILFPSRDEANFRLAIMKKLGEALGLKELRKASIEGTPGPRDH